jgi:hypothetical protein
MDSTPLPKERSMDTPTRITKVTLLGPAPSGGSYTAPTDDPSIPRLIAKGYTVSRTWEVEPKPETLIPEDFEEWSREGEDDNARWSAIEDYDRERDDRLTDEAQR